MSRAILCDVCGKPKSGHHLFKVIKKYFFAQWVDQIDICSDCWYSIKGQKMEAKDV